MKEVTDPTLLGELNKKEVVDPAILAQLEGTTVPDDTITHEEAPPSIPERLWSGFKGNLMGLARVIGKPTEVGKELGQSLSTEEGRQEFIRPIKESIVNPPGIPGRIGNYVIDNPLNTILNALPVAGTLGKTGSLGRLAKAVEPAASAIVTADKYTSKLPPLRETIVKEFEKGVRPAVAKRGTWPQVQAYYDNAESAVKSIIDSKDSLQYTTPSGEVVSGRLPKTLGEFSDAIHQTMKNVFEGYDRLTTEAGQAGIRVDLAPIVKELNAAANDKWLIANRPNVSSKLKNMADDYRKTGTLSPAETQDWIAKFNDSLKAFYKNPSYELANQASADAMVVNRLRASLDDVVTKATGPGYQELKNEYGALRSIENDVTKRYDVDARKNVKGLIDFSSIWSSAELIGGLVSMNPASIARAGTMEAVRAYWRHLNNPNTHVAKMFEKADKVYKPNLEDFTPPPNPPPPSRPPFNMGGSEFPPGTSGGGPIRYPEPNYPKYGPEDLSGRVPPPEFPPGTAGGGPIRYPQAIVPGISFPPRPPINMVGPEMPLSGPSSGIPFVGESPAEMMSRLSRDKYRSPIPPQHSVPEMPMGVVSATKEDALINLAGSVNPKLANELKKGTVTPKEAIEELKKTPPAEPFPKAEPPQPSPSPKGSSGGYPNPASSANHSSQGHRDREDLHRGR